MCLNNQVKDNVWLEITKNLGYSEVGAFVCLQMLYVGTNRGKLQRIAIASNLVCRGNSSGLIF